MKILITGAAGFVGSRLAAALSAGIEGAQIIGLDNLSRRGSESNLAMLRDLGCEFIHGDVRVADDVRALPRADWFIDCSANPSVLAGVDGAGAAQVVGHNLVGTLNLLEKCRADGCGFVMLSTSRVYSIQALAALPLHQNDTRFVPDTDAAFPTGFSARGISEGFSTTPPLSLYGATKLASEIMALEYGAAYGFPVWINRCGVLAGAGQFGKIDQGIFSFWIYQWLLGRPLSYIGFGGTGHQVRDLMSPSDLARLLMLQLRQPAKDAPRVLNAGGGLNCSMSLRELSDYCTARFGPKQLQSVPETRAFDIPFYVSDCSMAQQVWAWQPEDDATAILDEITNWAIANRSLIEAGF